MAAPIVDINIKPDLVLSGTSQIQLIDKTGVYSSINTGGWGTPNYVRDDVTVDPTASVCNIYITSPFQTTENYTITDFKDGAFYGFLKIYDRMTILPAVFSADVIEDGLWSFRFKFGISVTPYDYTVTWFNTASLTCCISKFGANLPSYDTAKIAKYNEMRNYLNGAQDAYDCGFPDRAETLLKKGINLCAETGCNCG